MKRLIKGPMAWAAACTSEYAHVGLSKEKWRNYTGGGKEREPSQLCNTTPHINSGIGIRTWTQLQEAAHELR